MASSLGDTSGLVAEDKRTTSDCSDDIRHYSMSGGTYHFKVLVPSVAAGAIIGKGGETIAQLQRETGTRVKMSKATDFYPGTRERVCLITGGIDGILHIHDFIAEKIREKPDPNAKLAIDFDHKQPAEREKQVKILVPNSTVGMIMGKGGSYIKQIKEKSGAYVQISQKSKDHALVERCITIIGEMDSNRIACELILTKIVQDPQSGNCLNVSYADVSGPVANFNPTGSPFANPSSSMAAGGKNNSFSSTDSLNSLSPGGCFQGQPQGASTPHHHHQGAQHQMGAFVDMLSMSYPSGGGGGTNGGGVGSGGVLQMIDRFKNMLRGSGYSEQALSEISSAIHTLHNYNIPSYNILHLCLPPPQPTSPPQAALPPPHPQPQHSMYGGMEGAAGGGDSMFSPISISSLGNGVSGLGLGGPPPQNYGGSPTLQQQQRSPQSDRFLVSADAQVFEPFRRSSPTLASPSAAALPPINNNSFGLGTSLKPPHSIDRLGHPDDLTKIDIEIGENIVGAILGPGGKALVEIQRFSGASIQISKKGIFAPGTRNRIVTITGLPQHVSTAQYLIEKQVTEEEAKRAQQNALGILH